MPWIQTKSGRPYDLECPHGDSILIEDVAYHLARIHRFTGATEYSVAAHSLYCLQMAVDLGYTALPVLRAVLMHDAHEAFIGDVSSPVKKCLGPVWVPFEHLHIVAFANRFNIDRSHQTQAVVAQVDARALMAEVRDLLGGETKSWGIAAEPHWRTVRLPASAEAAEAGFLKAFKGLV